VGPGSADEVVASLRVAEALGCRDAASVAPALALCDRVLAMLRRLTHQAPRLALAAPVLAPAPGPAPETD